MVAVTFGPGHQRARPRGAGTCPAIATCNGNMDQTGHSAGEGGIRIAKRRRGRNLHMVPSNLRPSPKRCVVRARTFSGEHNGMHTDLVPIPDPLRLRRQPLSKGRISQRRGKVSEAHDKRSPHRMGKFEEHASWPHGAYASRKGASSGPTHPMQNIRGRRCLAHSHWFDDWICSNTDMVPIADLLANAHARQSSHGMGSWIWRTATSHGVGLWAMWATTVRVVRLEVDLSLEYHLADNDMRGMMPSTKTISGCHQDAGMRCARLFPPLPVRLPGASIPVVCEESMPRFRRSFDAPVYESRHTRWSFDWLVDQGFRCTRPSE